MGQNRNPEISLVLIYNQLISNVGAKNIQWGNELSLQQSWGGGMVTHMQKHKIESLSFTIHKNQFQVD